MRLILFAFLFIPFWANSQVVLNEIASNNETLLVDDFGNTSDWIELFNSSTEIVNLEGYFLSDDGEDLQKWKFPSKTIAAQGFLLVFASDEDTNGDFLHSNFKLSAAGESVFLSNPQGELIDQMDFPALTEDITFGRMPDGASSLFYFDSASPNASNNDNSFFNIAPIPTFENQTFFHESVLQIELKCSHPNCQIYYSLDGSVPDENALLYSASFAVTETTSVRAISVGDNLDASPVATQTYFINAHSSIPIVSMSTDAALLFDSENGLFEDGPDAESAWPFFGANYWEDVEIPVHFEYFEAGHQVGFSHDLGMKVHGGRGARTNPLKPVRFLAKNRYGLEEMDYPFFKNRARTNYKRIVLRNASGDYKWTYMRDAFMNNFVLHEGFDIDCLAAQPVCWYINGAFWGLMYLREKSDEYYLQNNFGVDIDSLDLLEEDTLAIVGNYEHFNAFYDFVIGNDLSIDDNFQTAANQMDINSLADYFIIQTLSNNTDWPANNIKYWRERKDGAKWRYLLFDMDVALGGRGWTFAEVDSFGDKMTQFEGANRHVNILQAFLENPTYRNYFINRYADIINTSYKSDYLQAKVDDFVAVIDPFMQQHLDKWQNQTYDTWHAEKLVEIDDFVARRPAFALQYVQDYFELEDQVELTLNVYPPEAGHININTVTPRELPWKGVYYKGVPVELTVVPNAGFEFDFWQSLEAIANPNVSPNIKFDFGEDDSITAFFKSDKNELSLAIAPNPIVENTLNFSFVLNEISSVRYTIYQADGKVIFEENNQNLNAGLQYQTFDLPTLASGVYFLKVASNNQFSTRRFVY